jgi:hypothetical protein
VATMKWKFKIIGNQKNTQFYDVNEIKSKSKGKTLIMKLVGGNNEMEI